MIRRTGVATTICIACGLGILAYGISILVHGYTLNEMDWNQDGETSFNEILSASDIGKRTVIIEGKECIEYFAFKDGLGIKRVCASATSTDTSH